MAKSSVYKEIFSEYDLTASIRRPDITALLSGTENNQTIIIEVKRTSDKGYITDSVYKTLGYYQISRALLALMRRKHFVSLERD
jgi:hypothetical protein